MNDASEGELPQFSIEELLQEVVDIHADKDSPDYNECDLAECAWCESALMHIEAQRTGPTRDELIRLVEIAEENRIRVMNETFKHEHQARLDYLFSIDSHTSLIRDIKTRLGM